MSALANIVLPLVTKQILMCLRFMSNIFHCSKSTTETRGKVEKYVQSEQLKYQLCFEHISHLFLKFLKLTLDS